MKRPSSLAARSRLLTRLPSLATALLALVALRVEATQAVFEFPPPGLIRTVAVSDGAPCPGQLVAVSVTTQSTLDGDGPAEVTIDGWPGTPQIFQYGPPQPERKIRIFARTPLGLRDSQVVTIQVRSCAPAPVLRLLHSRNPFHRYRVDFRAAVQGKGRARSYHWSFGDGQQATTTEPFISHDYAPSIDHASRYSYFPVIVNESSSNLYSGRLIAIGSSFELSRSMGFVQADVEPVITKTSQAFLVQLPWQNHHTAPITFDRYLKQYIPCDPAQPPRYEEVAAESVFGAGVSVQRQGGVPSPGQVVIPTAKAPDSRLVLPLENIPPETCTLGFNLIGKSADGRDAYSSFYVQVRQNRLFTTKVVNIKTLDALKGLVQQHLVPNADRVTGEELYLLEQRGRVEQIRGGWRLK